ncbi:hypothetical protein [Marichromatium gracile]|uniref:Glycosyl hydrolase n=1 Tax=Marichromatium gracile TaxID=1048 RepID=A0ABR5VCI6_MARGR|nr:hypothetical protein [Marichromatium gracile]KXX63323.1 glycosyl hydrolase [Marichromatium gracile]
MSLVSTLVVLLLCGWCAILLVYRRRLLRLWREPMLAAPVLIIESDDWGPGPASHVAALERLVELLARHRDAWGRAAVMTIGAVLAIADTAAIRAGEISCYRRRRLCDSDGVAMREVLLAGRARGVLALQLHGMEHYWPQSLLTAARRDAEVRDWLETAAGSDTERLPSALQSRWTDVTTLPSRPLPEAEIRAAVAEEVACFETSFGTRPLVAVPPTFVWTEQVERAWAEAGVRVIITPGRRLTGRDRAGQPGGCDRDILNGERGAGGVRYLVRDLYFEPALGHRPERLCDELARHFALGRPALIETHRFNFTGEQAETAYAALETLLEQARARWPGLRFMSAEALAAGQATGAEWLVGDRARRLEVWLRRAARIDRLRKLAWSSGLALPVWALLAVLGAWRRGEEHG